MVLPQLALPRNRVGDSGQAPCLCKCLKSASHLTTALLYGLSQIVLAVIFLVVIIVRREGLLGQREVPLDRLFASRCEQPPREAAQSP